MSKTLNVRTDENVYELDADRWHIDERGQLHVNKGDNPAASFARDRWVAVEVVETSRTAGSGEWTLHVEGVEGIEFSDALRTRVEMALPSGAKVRR